MSKFATDRHEYQDYLHGIRHNQAQFIYQLLQVLLVGLTLGMMRTVVPALASLEFGVPKGSFMLLIAFVVAFGFVKGTLNFVAGRLSEKIGRKRVLLIGWLFALAIPFMIMFAPSWGWIVAATVLLGVNQGFAWSMTQTSKLDITRPDQRGLTIGLNEFAGYVGVATAGIVTAYMATAFGAHQGLLMFGLVVILSALVLTQFFIKETLPWAKAEGARHAAGQATGPVPRYPAGVPANPTTWSMFTLMTWRDRRMAALCQAGLVENLSMRWSGCFTRCFCTSKESASPTSAGSSAFMVLSGAPRNCSPASSQTASAATVPTCGACGFAVPASP